MIRSQKVRAPGLERPDEASGNVLGIGVEGRKDRRQEHPHEQGPEYGKPEYRRGPQPQAPVRS
jgi:hypothetical protein